MNPLNPTDWLVKASRDLELAKLALLHAAHATDLICYHAQQAAEKSIKALMVNQGLPLYKTHDLELLLDVLSDHGIAVEDGLYDQAILLKNYSVSTRYPDPAGDPELADAEQAFVSAQVFYSWASLLTGETR